MRNGIRILVASATIFGVAATAMALALNGNAGTLTPKADGNITSTIDAATLKTVALTDFEIVSGKVDKKFRIPLEGGKYIDGALIFNDCDHQYVGSTLGDAFGIDNSAADVPNAFNFNILFSLQKAYAASFDFTITNNKAYSILTDQKIKYASMNGDFYDGLQSIAVAEGYGYSSLVSYGTNGNFYAQFDFGINLTQLDNEDDSKSDAISHTAEHSELNYNIVCFQFTQKDNGGNPNFIPAHQRLSCELTGMSLTYACNS